MRSPTSSTSYQPEAALRALPTRGLAGGWRAPWDSDPRDALVAPWPSVNGPAAMVALDALEAEVRDLLKQ